MPKNSDENLMGLIEVPIITSRTGPMNRLAADLRESLIQCNRVRNAMMEKWLIWRRTNGWKPEVKFDKNGKPFAPDKNDLAPALVAEDGSVGEWEPVLTGKTKKSKNRKTGVVVDKPAVVYRRKGDGAAGTAFQNYLYHVGSTIAPEIATTIISILAGEVMKNLKTKASPEQRLKGHLHRWQAILAHDGQIPKFDDGIIPVPNNSAMFCYAGRTTGGGKKPAVELKKMVEYWGKSSAVLAFPLFSKESGRKVKSPIVTVRVGSLSPGNREVLAKVSRGEWKFSDSKMVFKKGRWQVQFTYQRPAENLGLDQSRIAVLYPQFPEASQPFRLESEHAGKRWMCGNGGWLAAEFERKHVRELRIRNRYKVSLSGVNGHGGKRFYLRLKPWARKTHDLQRHFVWQLIAEVVRFCKINNCGSVVYREPTLGIRGHLWLKDVSFDWTGLATNLSFKLKHLGIKCEIERIGGRELRERFGGESGGMAKTEPKPNPGNTPEAVPVISAARVVKDKVRSRFTKSGGKK